jgi:hypothetical protein
MDNVTEVVALLRKQADLEARIINGNGTTIAKQCFDVSVNQNGHVCLDARRSLQLCAFDGIDFMDQFDWHIGFSRQTLNLGIRIHEMVEGLVAPHGSSVFHKPNVTEKSASRLICPANLPFGS